MVRHGDCFIIAHGAGFSRGIGGSSYFEFEEFAKVVNTLFLLDIDCDWSEAALARAVLNLPGEVQARAARYRCAAARRNLIVTQTCLRHVVLRFAGKESRMELCQNGRPRLTDSNLEFNLSHTHSRAVLALACSPILSLGLGVDIEWMDRRVEREALANRFFTPREASFVRGDVERFFRVWTRKEAVLKSNGVGLRVELDSFEVLEDEIAQEVSGRPLVLDTQTRHMSYVVSWAVAKEWGDFQIRWIEAFSGSWMTVLAEGIEA